MSTINNTLQNYITKYIEQTFAAHTGNRYDKLYRELLDGVEKITKTAVNEATNYDKSLEELDNNPRFNKKFIRAFTKHLVSEFLNAHPKKKDAVAEFSKEHHINESDLKILEDGKDLVDKINNTKLIQKGEKDEEINIRKKLAKSIGMASSQVKESKVTLIKAFDIVK